MEADVASEFRYREPPLPQDGLGLLVSQSGETADTLAALRYMREQGQKILSIVNVPESSIARASDAILDTIAGPEIAVASTKAFTAQLTVLACLPWPPPRPARRSREPEIARLTACLLEIPGKAAEVLAHDQHDQAASPSASLRRATCSISAAAPATPSPWKAR